MKLDWSLKQKKLEWTVNQNDTHTAFSTPIQQAVDHGQQDTLVWERFNMTTL